MKKKQLIRAGSRKSALAMWQTEHVVSLLKEKNPQLDFEIIPISTKGDKILDVPLAKIGDKGLFTKELEVALLNKKIDFAVHSAKDMPTKLPGGLILSAMTKRYNPKDVFVSHKFDSLAEIPQGAKVGTSSLRRRAQLSNYRPDLNLVDIRGNLQTRLKRMQEEDMDGIILAAAGLERLGLEEHIKEYLDYSICLPAVGQGSLAIEVREDDEFIREIISAINDDDTQLAIRAERSLLRDFEGGCQIPIGARAQVEDGQLKMEALVASLDGTKLLRKNISTSIENPEKTGIALADLLREVGAEEILQEIRQGDLN